MLKSPDLMKEFTSILLRYHGDMDVLIVLSDSIIILAIVYWQHRVLTTVCWKHSIFVLATLYWQIGVTLLVTQFTGDSSTV